MAAGEDLLASIVEGFPQPIWLVDGQGVTLFTNMAAAQSLGYDDPSELIGRPSHDMVHYKRPSGEFYPGEECPFRRILESGAGRSCDEDWMVRRDGSMVPVSWWAGPIEFPSGTGLVAVYTDMTEKRRAERAARERDAAQIRAVEARAAHRRLVETTTALRRQMTRDLHDGVQQRLYALLIGLELTREETAGQLTSQLDEVIEQAQAAIDDLHDLVAGLHPAVLSTRGLVPAVESLATRTPMPVTVNADVPTRLNATIEVNAYFFVSEAVTNAVKHARASEITVDLRVDSSTLTVRVADDGIGGVQWEAAGTGLISLSDRMAALDGEFHVDSPPGRGTVVHGTIPLS